MICKTRYLLLCLLGWQALFAAAQDQLSAVRPAPVFGSHMVLQQQIPIRVWGTAPAGTPVHVQLGSDKKSTRADAGGNWLVTFPARKASFQSITLKINDLLLEDILVGEIWLCSGQSNMVRTLEQVQPEVISQAGRPALRVLNYTHDGVPLVFPKGFSEKMLARCNTRDFFRGEWQPSSRQTAGAFSAVAWYFGRHLQDSLKVPVGIIKVAVGGSAINNWITPQTLRADSSTAGLFTRDWFSNPAVDAGHRKRGREAFQAVIKKGEPWLPGKMPYRWMCEPGFLFEAGIAPLKHLSFRGVVWYQGETDAITEASTQRYQHLLPLLVNDWRRHFGNPQLPFLIVQLPGFRKETWPRFRQIQARAAHRLHRVWMTVNIDLGLKDDVHPLDKEPVGRRLFLVAGEYVYGQGKQNIFPEVAEVINGKDKTVLIFKPGKGALQEVQGALPGFELAGTDGQFSPAPAYITGSNTITLQHSGKTVTAVRYGWQPFPEPRLQLFNEQGLPAGPFYLTL